MRVFFDANAWLHLFTNRVGVTQSDRKALLRLVTKGSVMIKIGVDVIEDLMTGRDFTPAEFIALLRTVKDYTGDSVSCPSELMMKNELSCYTRTLPSVSFAEVEESICEDGDHLSADIRSIKLRMADSLGEAYANINGEIWSRHDRGEIDRGLQKAVPSDSLPFLIDWIIEINSNRWLRKVDLTIVKAPAALAFHAYLRVAPQIAVRRKVGSKRFEKLTKSAGYDCRILAAAIGLSCTHFVTADEDLIAIADCVVKMIGSNMQIVHFTDFIAQVRSADAA